jgi:hypothetical protein
MELNKEILKLKQNQLSFKELIFGVYSKYKPALDVVTKNPDALILWNKSPENKFKITTQAIVYALIMNDREFSSINEMIDLRLQQITEKLKSKKESSLAK